MSELANARREASKYGDLLAHQHAVTDTLRQENAGLSKGLSDAKGKIKSLKRKLKEEKESSEVVLYGIRCSNAEETGKLFAETETLRETLKGKETQLKVGFTRVWLHFFFPNFF